VINAIKQSPEAATNCKKEDDKAKIKTNKNKNTSATCGLDSDGLYAAAYLSHNTVLLGPNDPLVYSFCERVANQIDWSRVANIPAKKTSTEPPTPSTADRDSMEKEKARQRRELSSRLQQFLHDRGFDKVLVAPDLGNGAANHGSGAAGQPPDSSSHEEYVQIAAVHRFTIIKEMAFEFDIEESTNTGTVPSQKIVDQRSDLVLTPRHPADFCAEINYPCSSVIPLLQVTIDGKKKDGQDGHQVVQQTPLGDRWKLNLRLSDFLGQLITVKVYYKHSDVSIEILERSMQIEDIGLVTTFPVITEIVSAAKSGTAGQLSPTDNSYRSSIPLSWAFNASCKEGAHGAVTFPWMLGFNTRGTPHFSDIIKVFPHVSVILPLSSTAGTGPSCGSSTQSASAVQVGFGGGVALVNVFTISWALTTQGQQFVMLGLSAPDIVNMFK
jgi:hypothetical protein